MNKIYICNNCKKLFLKKNHYTNHINRKNPCKTILDYKNIDTYQITNDLTSNNNISDNLTHKQQLITENKQVQDKNLDNFRQNNISSIEHNCIYCKKEFTRKYGLKKHLEICKEKKIYDQDIENKDKLINLLIEEKDLLGNQNSNLIQKIENLQNQINDLTKLIVKNNANYNSNNNYSNNNSNNSITNNFVVKFGDETIDKLTIDEKLKICGSSFSAVKNYIESMHFNNRLPEYHNVYISDKKFKYGLTFDGNKFELQHLDFIIDDLLNASTSNIATMIKQHEIFSNLSDKNINHIERLIKMIKGSREQWFITDRRYEIKMILYNNRKIVEKTHKIL